jgi:acetyl esterase/lipase
MVTETESKPKREKPSLLSLLPLLLNLSVTAVLRLFKAPFRGSKGAPTLKQDVAYAVTRVLLSKLKTSESQGFARTTERVYEKEAEKHEWNHHTIDIGNGAKGHWLGKPDAKYVLLFFHGGGYIGYATPGHLKYQFALQKAIRQAGHDISIFSASYTLAPQQKYPFQLSQAVEVLRYLVVNEKRDPQTVRLSGYFHLTPN